MPLQVDSNLYQTTQNRFSIKISTKDKNYLTKISYIDKPTPVPVDLSI